MTHSINIQSLRERIDWVSQELEESIPKLVRAQNQILAIKRSLDSLPDEVIVE